MEIRGATLRDIPWLVTQLRDFYKFFGETRIPLFPSDEIAHAKLADLIEKHIVFVADESGELKGVIGGIVSPHFFNPMILTLGELFWWVPTQFRRSSVGLRLLDAFVEWGRDNVDWVTFALEHNSPVREETLFRRGFVRKESAFLLEVA